LTCAAAGDHFTDRHAHEHARTCHRSARFARLDGCSAIDDAIGDLVEVVDENLSHDLILD